MPSAYRKHSVLASNSILCVVAYVEVDKDLSRERLRSLGPFRLRHQDARTRGGGRRAAQSPDRDTRQSRSKGVAPVSSKGSLKRPV